MKIRIWHIVVFVLALAVFAVARAPAAFFVPQRPGQLTYASAQGTVWDAELRGVEIGQYSVGAATWTLSPLDLVQGKAIIPVTLSDGDLEGGLMLLGNWHGHRRIGIENLTVNGLNLRGVYLPGQTQFFGLDVLFEDDACVRASGRVTTDVFERAGQAIGWAGPSLAGTASCDGDNARILLSGANPQGERVNARVLLRPDGAASWRVTVQTERSETVAALNAAGFSRGAADGLLGYGEDTRWLP